MPFSSKGTGSLHRLPCLLRRNLNAQKGSWVSGGRWLLAPGKGKGSAAAAARPRGVRCRAPCCAFGEVLGTAPAGLVPAAVAQPSCARLPVRLRPSGHHRCSSLSLQFFVDLIQVCQSALHQQGFVCCPPPRAALSVVSVCVWDVLVVEFPTSP